MKTSLAFHERAEPALEAWIRDVSAREPGGQIIARLVLDDIQHKLMSSNGMLKDAIADTTLEPTHYWWRYDRDLWISYVVRDRGHLWWRSRRIIIYSIGGRPPDRVAASFPQMR